MAFEDIWGVCEKCTRETNLILYKAGYWCKHCIQEDRDKDKSWRAEQESEILGRIIDSSWGD